MLDHPYSNRARLVCDVISCNSLEFVAWPKLCFTISPAHLHVVGYCVMTAIAIIATKEFCIIFFFVRNRRHLVFEFTFVNLTNHIPLAAYMVNMKALIKCVSYKTDMSSPFLYQRWHYAILFSTNWRINASSWNIKDWIMIEIYMWMLHISLSRKLLNKMSPWKNLFNW